MNKAELKSRIVLRLIAMKKELSQIIIDKRSWNDNRPEETPFDIGWETMMRQCVAWME